MLTTEVRSYITKVIEHIEASHVEAAEVMWSMKKLFTTIPVGAFCLLLQVMVQPCIMIQHWWLHHVWPVKPKDKHCTASLIDMVPDGQLSQNLPNPLRTLAAILHYQLKNETGIKVSIMTTSKVFGTLEKLLCQALKGVHYKFSTQKHRQEDVAYDKQEDSSSSEETDDEDDEKGAVTKIKLLKKKPKMWCETTDEKWKHVTPKLLHHYSLPSGSNTPTGSLLYSKFSLPGSHFTFSNSPVNIKKATLNLKFNQILSFSIKHFKKWPFTLPKTKYKTPQIILFEPKNKKHHKLS